MDLLTLPDEMLASVYRYTCFSTLLKLRKMSTKLNKIAKKYGFDKPNMRELTITAKFDATLSVKLDTCCDRDDNLKYITHMNENLYSILEYYFSKFRRLNFLQFIDFNEQRNLTEDVAKLLLKQRSLRLTALSFARCELQFDIKLLRKCLLTFPITGLALHLYVNDKDNSPYKDEFFADLQFDELDLKPLNSDSFITLHCLEQLCAREMPRHLVITLNAPVVELAQFLEGHIDASFHLDECCWSFTVQPGTMNNISYCIKNLECLANLSVNQVPSDLNQLNFEVAGFYVWSPKNPRDERKECTWFNSGFDRPETYLKIRVML